MRKEPNSFGRIIGTNKYMGHVFRKIDKAAKGNDNILVEGETGTGKELVAREIHDRSGRRNGPFIAINCSAVPDNLLEAEFFGYEKGAFTGANQAQHGKIEMAHNGTLFLDEIGTMSIFCQSKILRMLEQKVIERVGSRRTIPVDFRLICASSMNLRELIRMNRFRKDLFFRIDEIDITLPELVKRKEDIPLLIEHFLNEFSNGNGQYTATKETVGILKTYSWPGNVRELKNVLKKAILETEDIIIDTHHLHPEVTCAGENDDTIISLKEMEKRHIFKTLEHVNNNKRKAAMLLGIKRSTLYKKLEKYNQEESSNYGQSSPDGLSFSFAE